MESKERLKKMVLATIKEIEELPKATEEKRKEFDNNILSVVYSSSFDKGKQVYNGAELLVAFGGPNIYINTRYNLVSGYWGSDRVEFNYSDDNDLYSEFEEYFYSSL